MSGSHRAGRSAPLVAALAASLVLLAQSARSAAPADSLIRDIERLQRGGSRLARMEITMTRHDGSEEMRQIIALNHRSGATDRLLFVVTEPKTLRGITLLFTDAVAPGLPDSTWIFFPGFDTPRLLEARAMKTYVVGTDITYEDAKGWLSAEQYEFSPAGDSSQTHDLLAAPKSDSLAAHLGYSRLDVRVDPARRVITRIVFHGLGGAAYKDYNASDFERIGEHWFPRLVAITQRIRKQGTLIETRYQPIESAPPDELFVPSLEAGPFIERLSAWMAKEKLGFPD